MTTTATTTTPAPYARLSKLYAPTLKETPAEAELPSHKLLLRAGFIRKTAAGIYTILPLGWRVIRNIEQIVREEMEAIGSQELRLPILQPKELWDESGRWNDYGPELMRMTDRHDRPFALGPTHEEVITTLVNADLRSYRELPLSLFQMNTKFRDERRPRFGLLRGREFLMKDAYSFHATPASLQEHYDEQAQAYAHICDRLGLTWRAVEADSGQIGGKVTKEFMAIADAGEDDIVYCACGFAANIEVFEGNTCPTCGLPLQRARGIEVAQVFQLGTKYSDSMHATFSDEDGNEAPFYMGCYGVGISRAMAAVVEQHNDETGIQWPTSIAPYQVVVIPLGNDEKVGECAHTIARQAAEAGLEVVLDDRDERPGVKFADADLIGWPYQLVIGGRGLEKGIAEFKVRATGEKNELPLDALPQALKRAIL
jgi:prolyl-tRNA synthetase